MQVNIFGLLSDPAVGSSTDAFVKNLAMLQGEGFRRAWIGQLPYEPDVLTALAVALREVDVIEVGCGVVPIQIQHPMQMAQRALTLSQIARGRFTLGLGMTHQVITEEMWGIRWQNRSGLTLA